jgi:hypothetical protein
VITPRAHYGRLASSVEDNFIIRFTRTKPSDQAAGTKTQQPNSHGPSERLTRGQPIKPPLKPSSLFNQEGNDLARPIIGRRADQCSDLIGAREGHGNGYRKTTVNDVAGSAIPAAYSAARASTPPDDLLVQRAARGGLNPAR